MNDNILTVFDGAAFSLAEGYSAEDVINKLGEIELLISAGQIIPPGIKQGDTVYFIYKGVEVLEGVVDRILSVYDRSTATTKFSISVHNEWYGTAAQFTTADLNISLFRTQAAANDALASLQNAETET